MVRGRAGGAQEAAFFSRHRDHDFQIIHPGGGRDVRAPDKVPIQLAWDMNKQRPVTPAVFQLDRSHVVIGCLGDEPDNLDY
jgi:hypothetical protein